MIKSNRCVKIPVKIAETPVILSTDVIDYDIPLLLSKEAMKKAKTQIDFCEDKVHNFGRKIDIKFSSSGHYCIPLGGDVYNQQIVFLSTNLRDKSNEEKVKIAAKLHRQFAHPHSGKMKLLLRDAQIIYKDLEKYLDDLDNTCEVCLKYKKPKPRPVVGFPMAKTFNKHLQWI